MTVKGRQDVIFNDCRRDCRLPRRADNIVSVAHCATRLRVMVADENKIDKKRIEDTEKVKGAFFNSGQYQIIFGTGTSTVYLKRLKV